MAASGTVLVVDDDAIVTLMLSRSLERAGRDVVVAPSWRAAREAIETTIPALVVLDLMLPDADGREVIAALRAGPATARVPVMILSGEPGARAREECLALGADDYVEKPFAPAELVARVNRLLDGARPAGG